MLKDGKTIGYLKYAIGEIILVVIGILMALQVNNWNEHRKLRLEVKETIGSLKQELEDNIGETNGFVNSGYILGDILRALKTNGHFERPDNENFGSFYGDFDLFDTFVRELNTENLDHWISLEKDLTSEEKDFLPVVKELKKTILERRVWESKATDLSLQRFKEFADDLSWFYNTDSLSNLKREQYIKTNPEFRNKAIHYLNFQLNENVYYGSYIRNLSLIMLWKLKSLEENKTSANIKDLLIANHLKPFKSYPCDTSLVMQPESLGFRNSVLVFNATDELKTFKKIKQNGASPLNFTLKPNTFYMPSINENEYIQEGSDCKTRYAPVKYGFLVLENN
ncbi:hypothetical protein GCM10022260_07740 [Gaetbulibacter aestuarii]